MASPATNHPELEVHFYGYGCTMPQLILSRPGTVAQHTLYIIFKQPAYQNIYIFQRESLIFTAPATRNLLINILIPGQYTLFFGDEINDDLEHARGHVLLMNEMILFAKHKGSLRSENYPIAKIVLEQLHINMGIWRGEPVPCFYGVGEKQPTFHTFSNTTKMIICMLFDQSIYQIVKVFYNCRYYATLSNCFKELDTSRPGKYVVVFEKDSIYNMTNAAIETYLAKTEEQFAPGEMKGQKGKGTKKKSKEKVKRKKKKHYQRRLENQSSGLKPAERSKVRCPEEMSQVQENIMETAREPIVRNKIRKKEEFPAEVLGETDDEPSEPSSFEEPEIPTQNKFSLLELDDDRNLKLNTVNTGQYLERRLEHGARTLVADVSTHLRAEPTKGKQSSSSSTPESGLYSGEGESPSFEEISVEELKDPVYGTKAVVVGIQKYKGLIVQTLPPTEEDSEFFILDYCSHSISGSPSLTNVAFDVKLLHVFLEVLAVSNIGNEGIINKNQAYNGKTIEKRIISYSLADDTLCNGVFRRGYRDPASDEPQLEKKEKKLICLIVKTDEEDKPDIVRVVGPPSHLSFLAQLTRNRRWDDFSSPALNSFFEENEFIIADSFTADPFFKLHIMFDTLCLIKSYQAEEDFKQQLSKMGEIFGEMKKCLGEEEADVDSFLLHSFPHTNDPPNGDTFLFNIQKLSSKEEKKIKTCCKDVRLQEGKKKKTKKRTDKKRKAIRHDMEDDDSDEEYSSFRLYIRDPALSICRFNSYDAWRNSQLYTIRTRTWLVHKKGDLFLTIMLNNDQVNQVLSFNKETKSNNYWREGAELKIFNPALEREKQTRFGLHVKSDADVVIDEIELFPYKEADNSDVKNGTNPVDCPKGQEMRARIKLRPGKSSKELFDVLKEGKDDFSQVFSKIGPCARDGASESIATGLLNFKTFYRNRQFFNWWRGYQEPDFDENEDYMDDYIDKVIRIDNRREPEKSFILDESQLTSFKHAFHRNGITSIGAGPGSGKTLLSGGLVCDCYTARPKERMAVTATTNMGVNNAVEKIAELQPGFPISREMSKKAEVGISPELEKYCLQYQSLHSEQTHPLLLKVRKEYRKVLAYYKKAGTRKEKLNRLEMLHYAESKVKRTYLRTVVPFCGASTPALLIRHADHYNWVINGDGSDGRHVRRDIKHMIIDEASLLPYYTSLALCCSFPQLEKITIIGDRMQLGPHCVLYNQSGLLYDLCVMSELDRINSLTTVKECLLRMNYRSHPSMVERFQQPHYGESFKPALTYNDRTLAFSKHLPLLQWDSAESTIPFAFINIGDGDDCHNKFEREGVLKLLGKLMKKDVRPAGISILCFHRKQKEEMEKSLRHAHYRDSYCKMKTFIMKLGGVYTIDSFQGRENDIIIVCTTKTVEEGRTKHGCMGIFQFVANQQRGIVAVSRAKEAMYVFGQWKYLKQTGFWKDKVTFMEQKNLLFDEDWNQIQF